MGTPSSQEIRQSIDAQHPDAGALMVDCRSGEGRPRKLAYRPRDEAADEDVMDMVVLLNPPPIDGDPRPPATGAAPRRCTTRAGRSHKPRVASADPGGGEVTRPPSNRPHRQGAADEKSLSDRLLRSD